MSVRRLLLLSAVIAAATLLVAGPATAATAEAFTNAAGGNSWATPGNWANGVVPYSNVYTATIGTSAYNNAVANLDYDNTSAALSLTYVSSGTGSAVGTLNIQSGGKLAVGSIYCGGGTSGTGTINVQTGGSLLLTNAAGGFSVGSTGSSTGNLNVSGGTVTIGSAATDACGLTLAGGSAAKGYLNLSAGKLEILGTTDAAFKLASGSKSTAICTITGGQLSVACPVYVSFNTASATAAGTIDQQAGTVQFTSTSATRIGSGSGTTGIYKLSGGTLTTTAGMIVGGSTNTYASYYSQSGGSASIGGAFTGNGSLNLSAGTLNLNNHSISTTTVNFTGGTLQDLSGVSVDVNLGASNPTLQLGAGITTTISNLLKNYTGQVGSLTKAGDGSLILTNANTYSGATTITGGTLTLGLTGSIASNLITVASSAAAFDISSYGGYTLAAGKSIVGIGKVVGDTYVDSGASLAAGSTAGAVGTLTVDGILALTQGSTYTFDLDTPTTSDKIAVTSSGILALGSQKFSDFAFNPTAGFGPGVYTLFQSSQISGRLSTTDTTGTINGYAATISKSGTNVILTVAPEPSTLALLAAGVMGLLAYAWRRRK